MHELGFLMSSDMEHDLYSSAVALFPFSKCTAEPVGYSTSCCASG
jgi:hypothetical protein